MRPLLMVAPNGARRGKKEHPALPLSVGEVVAAAEDCAAAGADAIHAHVRDADGRHVLDAGLCRELLRELSAAVPHMTVQITTEAAGRYSPDAQRQFLRDLRPPHASVAPSEILADGDIKSASRLYHWSAENDVRIQHILYRAEEVEQLSQLADDGVVSAAGGLSALFVLGRGAAATPAMLSPFLSARALSDMRARFGFRFMVCAFGKSETDCLLAAAAAGGDCRVGFENNLQHPNGVVAKDNAERVAEVAAALEEGGFWRAAD